MNIINKFTVRTLRKNKVRTLITIIGIILSVSMITAVTTFISSLQNYLVDVTIANEGDWHGAVFQLNKEELSKLTDKKDVTDYGYGQNIGYANANTLNEYKPYLFIFGIGEGFEETMPIKLLEGKLPTNSTELLLPKHLQTNGSVTYKLGDVITLDIGDRKLGEHTLYQNIGLSTMESGEPEELVIRERNTYTVVGFYERPGFEDFSAPGYTALTVTDNKEADSYNVYFKVKDAKSIYQFIENNYMNKEATYNNEYLRLISASNDSSYNRVLYGLGSILIIIIMFGSVSLIYNAFSISISERMKQFGLISSIGATKKQIRNSVLFEALALSIIGIPIGIISGIAGIGVTLALTGKLFLSFMQNGVALRLHVSLWAVLVAAFVGLVTVLISAYIPARRAVKVSAIDAIRLTADISIKAKKVRTSRLTYKLFGFEGMIASKNFKRNRRKYRATVVSLFMSIVLFVSASSFCAYLTKGVSTVIDDRDFDISYSYNPMEESALSFDQLLDTLNNVEGVTGSSYNYPVYTDIYLQEDDLNKDYLSYMKELYGESYKNLIQDGKMNLTGILYFVDDTTYESYLKEMGYQIEKKDQSAAIAMDTVKFYDVDSGKYRSFRLLNNKNVISDVLLEQGIEDFYRTSINTDDEGNVFYEYQNDKGETRKYPREEVTRRVPVEVAEITEKGPIGIGTYYGNSLTLILPFSEKGSMLENTSYEQPISLYFKTTDHKEVFNRLYKVLEESQMPTQSLYDALEAGENERAMVTIISIFSYGFIVLISLIAAANVFNTISTNIALRRVEFAMLKSVGMTSRGFNKMMNYECLLYGLKGLLYGLPVSILITYYIHRNIMYGLEMAFFIPWNSIVIAIGSVFTVVFATMLFSMNKVKKENTIDALKNENI